MKIVENQNGYFVQSALNIGSKHIEQVFIIPESWFKAL